MAEVHPNVYTSVETVNVYVKKGGTCPMPSYVHKGICVWENTDYAILHAMQNASLLLRIQDQSPNRNPDNMPSKLERPKIPKMAGP